MTAVAVLPDREMFAALLHRAPWLTGARPEDAQLRLRVKPGTNLRAGAVVPTDTGPAAVLLASFADPEKTAKLEDTARRNGAPVLRAGDWVVLPAWADPALHGLVPSAALPLGYNPDRRWVGRLGCRVLKVHAEPPSAGARALTAALLPGARSVTADGRMVLTGWVPGRPPRAGDEPAITEAVSALHATAPPPGLDRLDPGELLDAAELAAAAVVETRPAEADRVRALLTWLRTALPAGWPTDEVVLHGDLSPDQVIIRADGSAALLDLDRATLGPAGWDGAQWAAASVAAGGTALESPVPVPPALLVAACLLRAPEPFRRLRARWPEQTTALLDLASVSGDVGYDPHCHSRGLTWAFARLPAGLTPQRSWPERGGTLAVEAVTAQGEPVALRIDGPEVTVLDGTDPALPGLPAAADAVLLGHRAGRRAVLRQRDGYLKVVRPGRASRVVAGLETARALLRDVPGAPLIPEVLRVDDRTGVVLLAELAGPTLHRLLAEDPVSAVALAGRAGAALAGLQSAEPDGLPAHGHSDEGAVLCRWTTDAAAWGGADRRAQAEQVAARLSALPGPRWVPAHRDLHDKQLVACGLRVGLLDLDTLARADPALDLANLLAHLRLRVLQGRCGPTVAARCCAAVRERAGDRATPGALDVYTAATLLRLAAVYTFRPGHRGLPEQLAAAALDDMGRSL